MKSEFNPIDAKTIVLLHPQGLKDTNVNQGEI